MYLKNIFILIAYFLSITWLLQVQALEKAKTEQSLNQDKLNQKLFDAIKNGNLGDVKDAINDGASLEYKNKNGHTSFIFAVSRGQIDIVRYLIEEQKINVYCANSLPLRIAAMMGHQNIVRYFLEKEFFDINCSDSGDYTALYLAVHEGHLPVVRLLVEHKSFNPMIDGVVAMSLAHQYQKQEVIGYLASNGIPVIPQADDSKALNGIFYNEKVNSLIDFYPLEILAYNSIPIGVSSNVASISENGKMHIYQIKVLEQGAKKDAYVTQQLEYAAERLGGTSAMHYDANPIFGGTCAYHAIKNALVCLLMLYDYDDLAQCSEVENLNMEASKVSSDIESLRVLKTNNFDGERFIEQLNAKIFMVKSKPEFGSMEPIRIYQAVTSKRMHYASNFLNRKIVSIIESHCPKITPKYNSLSFVDEKSLNYAKMIFEVLQFYGYDTAKTIDSEIQQSRFRDLLKQVSLFRKCSHYRHAFIFTLNEGSQDGRVESYWNEENRMHAIAVIIDKRESVVNVIICESNNQTDFVFKPILYNFLDLFIDEELRCGDNDQLVARDLMEGEEMSLSSFKSLVGDYEHTLTQYKGKPTRDEMNKLFLIFSQIEHVYKLVKAEARKSGNNELFALLKNCLNSRLKHDIRSEEIRLHELVQKLELKELNDVLLTAASRGNLDMIKKSMQLGACIDARDDYGNTLLMNAVESNIDIVKYVLSLGVQIDEVNNNGFTALMTASWKSLNPKIVELLIQQHANVNMQDRLGDTALTLAVGLRGNVEEQQLETVNILINLGNADLTIKNANDLTALDLASPEIAQVLKSKLMS